MMQYVKAIPLARSKEVRDDGTIVEIVIWQFAEPMPPSEHLFKYRLFYGGPSGCRVRYDNERGKGDHRHVGDRELDYEFTTVERLLDDFEQDVEKWSAV